MVCSRFRFRLTAFLFSVSLALAQVHKVPVQPGWFPSDSAGLNRVLDDAFRAAETRMGGGPPRPGILGLVVPHAGLEYSGAIAAAAYRVMGQPRNIIVLGFSHSRPVDGVVAPALSAYQTPLGTIPIDAAAVRELGFRRAPEAQLCDHSVENQLPFIQRVAPGATVTPVYVGELSAADVQSAACALAARLAKGDVIVASSDLTHYGRAYGYTPFPNDAALPERLRDRATGIFEAAGSLDVAAFDHFLSATGDNLCGRGPIRLLMAALRRWKEDVYETTLDYMASGERSRDYSLSVGYGALAFYPVSSFQLGREDQARLLASARRTLDAYVRTGRKTADPVPAAERSGALGQRSGVFVTIRKKGELRGCIGAFTPPEPLWSAVADRTLAAAVDDPRFPPLKAAEGPVTLEISILTPLKALGSWNDFHTGEGAVLVLNGHSSTLLPQVAAEMRWSREQFLENLALKAGLEPRAYRNSGARLYVYSAQVFSE